MRERIHAQYLYAALDELGRARARGTVNYCPVLSNRARAQPYDHEDVPNHQWAPSWLKAYVLELVSKCWFARWSRSLRDCCVVADRRNAYGAGAPAIANGTGRISCCSPDLDGTRQAAKSRGRKCSRHASRRSKMAPGQWGPTACPRLPCLSPVLFEAVDGR